MTEAAERQHYHLITGEIVFRKKDIADQAPNAMRLNAIIRDPDKGLPLRMIIKAQQSLQANFFLHMTEEEQAQIVVVDLITIGISYLGEFTEAAFKELPEGMEIQERVPATSGQENGPKLSVVPNIKLEDAIAEANAKKAN